jgi:hypothetical protein
MAENRFAKYAGQGGPMIPGTGPKPPPDPRQAAAVAGAESSARAFGSLPAEQALINARIQAELAADAEKRRRDAAEKNKPMVLTPEQKRSIRIDALDKTLAARRAIQGSNSFLGTGFMAPTAANFGGTNAAKVKAAA